MIFRFLFNAIYLGIAFYIGKETTSVKLSTKKGGFFLILLWLCINIFNFSGPSHWSGLFIFLSLILLYRVLFRFTWSKSISIDICFFSIISIAEYIGGLLSNISAHFHEISETYFSAYFLALTLAGLTLWVFIKILINIFHLYDRKIFPTYGWFFICFPVLFFTLFLNSNDYLKIAESQRMILAIFFIFIISSFILLFLYIKTSSVLKIEKELAIQKEKEKYLENQIDFFDQQYKLNFSFVHDFLQQESKLVNLVEQGNKSEAIRLLESLSQNTFREFNGILSESNVFNAIVTQFQNRIHQSGFQLKTTISINDFEFMSLSEQYEFFHQLLNRILTHAEHRTREEDKNISIVCRRNHAFLRLECLVPCSHQKFEYSFDVFLMNKYQIKVHHRKLEEYEKEKIDILIHEIMHVR